MTAGRFPPKRERREEEEEEEEECALDGAHSIFCVRSHGMWCRSGGEGKECVYLGKVLSCCRPSELRMGWRSGRIDLP